MSLFGAMNTAISGLSAQSNAFGNISDNVANSQTTGYKRVDTAFVDYLTTSTAANNVPGAVVTRPEYVNNVEGTITQTDNPLGLAITGQGFFAVSKQAGVANNLPTFDTQQEYSRAGDFQMDKNGFLKNSAGLFLNGWPVTTDPITNATVVNQNILAPIQVSQTVFNPVATGNVSISANLPATPPPGSTAVAYKATDADVIAQETATALSATNQAALATAALDPNAATATALAATATTDAAAALAAPGNVALANTAALSAAAAIAGAALPGFPVTAPTVVAGNFRTPTPAAPVSSNVDVFDALGTMHTVTLNWQQNPVGSGPPPGAKASNWTVSIAIPDQPGFTGSADVTFGSNGADPGTVGLVNNGVSNGPNGIVTTGAFDPTNKAAQPASLTFTATFGGVTQPILLKLGTYDKSDGITQYAGTDYNLRGLTQDGVPPGAFSSVTTQANGDVNVNYDNGQSRVIFRVPVIMFNNPNGLQRQDGQAFTVSQDSGGPLAETPSTNGAGDLLTQSLESSNVDIATEFSKLIVAQRAYTANTKMITTADDMLQQTIDMKR
jgi:flagellar hook-basal body protein